MPDEVVRRADQIELVDMSPEALRRRMAHGNIYPPERVDAALANYFRPGNLAALRELALLWVADRVEEGLQGYMEAHGIADTWETARAGRRRHHRGAGRRAARAGARRASPGGSSGGLIGVHVVPSDGLETGAGPALADAAPAARASSAAPTARSSATACRRRWSTSPASEMATQMVIGASRRSRWHELLHGAVVERDRPAGRRASTST